jgi:hypothetical protein
MRFRPFHRPFNTSCPKQSGVRQIKIRAAEVLPTNWFQHFIERCCAGKPPAGTARAGSVALPLQLGSRQQVIVVTECNPRCLGQPSFITSGLVLFSSLPVVPGCPNGVFGRHSLPSCSPTTSTRWCVVTTTLTTS